MSNAVLPKAQKLQFHPQKLYFLSVAVLGTAGSGHKVADALGGVVASPLGGTD
jgi:hypothetical protein